MNCAWRLDSKTTRCHVEKNKLKVQILRLAGASPVNTYYDSKRGNMVIGWDVDVPAEKRDIVRRILKCRIVQN